MDDPRSPSTQSEIYVNYLPTPPRIARFMRVAVPAGLWITCIVAFLWAQAQRSPGDAVWSSGAPIQISGFLDASPYPLLFARQDSGSIQAILLVEQGKIGTQRRAVDLHGRVVRASGWLLQRDGRRILELEPGPAGLAAVDDAAAPASAPPLVDAGTMRALGEIVDSKCFLGAMKPGSGKTHKECATLCVRGGIPPVLVTASANGAPEYLLIQSPTGGPIAPELHALIADPIEVRGRVLQWQGVAGLRVLRLAPGDAERLPIAHAEARE